MSNIIVPKTPFTLIQQALKAYTDAAIVTHNEAVEVHTGVFDLAGVAATLVGEHDAAEAPHTGKFDAAGAAAAAQAASEPVNANIQAHVTGTGSPHTAAGVGAAASDHNHDAVYSPLLVPILSVADDTLLTSAQCKGYLVFVTASKTITLPAVVIGGLVTIYSTTAVAIYIDPNDDDRIILDGAPGGNGKKLTSASGAGDFVTLIGDSADGWVVIGRSGAWTMEG